jgi:hypothetical protein
MLWFDGREKAVAINAAICPNRRGSQHQQRFAHHTTPLLQGQLESSHNLAPTCMKDGDIANES